MVIAKGSHARELLERSGSPATRFPYALLVDPGERETIHPYATLPFTRIAWVESKNRERTNVVRSLGTDLASRGISLVWFEPTSDNLIAREETVRLAMAWLRAGEDLQVCNTRSAHMRVECASEAVSPHRE